MSEVGIRVITVNWKSQDTQYIPEVQTEILHSINEPTEGLYKLLSLEIKDCSVRHASEVCRHETIQSNQF